MTRKENNKRIAKNTLLLYFRMLLTITISLYTSRVVLSTLGVEDFGIYHVVGGVVAMFSLLSGSLSAAVGRFLTFELGKENFERLKLIFSTSIIIHIGMAFIIWILAELIGVWFLNTRMNIPSDRMIAANWVLQSAIIVFIINLVSVPYNAAIIAHERMKFFAYVSIIEVSLKLLGVFLLVIFPYDKLSVYAVLMLMVSLIIRLIYTVYCKKHFAECRYELVFDKTLLKEMSSFTGWNMIGSGSTVLMNQGINILLNIFSGLAVNAARGIASQVNYAINSFVTNFMTALNPQITKTYASGDHEYMFILIQQGTRLSFYMLLLLCLPVIIETETILNFWLTTVPEHTVNFIRLILIFTMSEVLSKTLITAMLATGQIKKYQILVGGLQMMNFPLSYLFLEYGFFPEITLIIAIMISQLCLVTRLWLLREMIGISIKNYLTVVYGNALIVTLLAIILPCVIYFEMGSGITRFLLVGASSTISTLMVIFFFGMNSRERQLVLDKLLILRNKISR
ncbi:hypothetical protein W03_10840 [Nitrosomonas sp. PY1]|uniref:MATE family efflux transporter n=1 Tax=Nitrosomonas sp. PY1 TaxID=1803906 RepID=UPI001FC89589|nr:MATE family efflux transporter [Nitrosomonas sp. PY1]GKS69080.1 hypothetical protein W03_10840 [Nitrosomonas sp. PY1]